jgi:hypothetical protein
VKNKKKDLAASDGAGVDSQERGGDACADCGSTGHDTGSDTCPGPDVQDRLDDPNRQEVR